MQRETLRNVGECVWEVSVREGMRVPVRVYAGEGMLSRILADNAMEQALNVARLPGIVTASLAMPDMHWGYGFPIGGVAAFDPDGGIVSPGGVGYDINCGVRLLTCNLEREALGPRLDELVDSLFDSIPVGVGTGGSIRLSGRELRKVVVDGARWAVASGYGEERDAEYVEEGGRMSGADPGAVSERAWARGREQVGTLGAGNHFLEVGYVDEIFDPAAAQAYGLAPERIVLMIHCGSRGFGHQVCDDSLGTLRRAARKYGLPLPDPQLACAPLGSPEAERYLGAMRAAVNYAFANRQVIAHLAAKVFLRVFGNSPDARLRTVYEVAHNIAKMETHVVDGTARTLCVHRKGATRAFGPGRLEVPAAYRAVGQPVLIPGDMGTCSYVLVGTATAMSDTFGSACHGAGRAMSRRRALKAAQGRDLFEEMRARGVRLRARSKRTIGEEMPAAYKDVSEVVEACHRAGIARKVARLRPLGVIKG